MPRIARKTIAAHFIHVMVQGINKEYIFDNNKSLNYYLKSIKSSAKHKEFDLLAYCMMNNHAHFLFYVMDMNSFGLFMKSVNQNFANHYNNLTSRVGTVFRNRYQVEPIYDCDHLINCIKYIHDNPVKAGMVRHCSEYPYSSYHDYLYEQGCAKCEILKEVFGENVNYLKAIESSSDRPFIDFESNFCSYEYFESGINSFMKEYNIALPEIFSERQILFKAMEYLKKEFKISYVKIIRYLGFPRGMANSIEKN